MNRIIALSVPIRQITAHLCTPKYQPHLLLCHGYKSYEPKVRKELYKRRIAAGPEPDRPRSAWRDWNYDAELYAFGKRLHEDFSESILRSAFVQESYIEQEKQKQQDVLGTEVETESSALGVEGNTELAFSGHSIASNYIVAYLRKAFPKLNESGVADLHNYLLSEEVLAHVSSHIGTKDLILCSEFPVPEYALAKTLMAVVGALAKSQGTHRAELFVQDFILAQLHGKELMHLLDITNPMGILAEVLNKEGRGEPEPRLLWETGASTVEAAYVVGIYSDKRLVGQSPGETLPIAEEMAARDALRKYFGLMDNSAALKFGEKGHQLNVPATE